MKIHILLLMAFLPFTVFSQTLFGTSGGTISDSNHQFDFSIGEVVVADLSGSGQMVNVGFQQPYYDFFISTEAIKKPNFQVFPNPFSARFQFISDLPISSYVLYDALGKAIKNQQIEGESFVFDKPDLPKGFYSLQVQFKNHSTQIVNLIHQ